MSTKVKVIPRNELCLLLQVTSGSLRSYISRRKLFESQKGFLNVYNPKNQEWIIDFCDKKGIDYKPIFLQTRKDSLPNRKTVDSKISLPDDILSNEAEKPYSDIEDDLNEDLNNYTKLRDNKLKKEVEKLEVETRLKILEESKKRAKVLPVDFIAEWSARNIRGVFGQTVNFGNQLISDICKDLDGDIEIKLKYKKMFKDGFNDILNKGIKDQEPEAIEHAKEYSLLNKW